MTLPNSTPACVGITQTWIFSLNGGPPPSWLTIDQVTNIVSIYQEDNGLSPLNGQTFKFIHYSQFDDYVTSQDGLNTLIYQNTRSSDSTFEVTFIKDCWQTYVEHDFMDVAWSQQSDCVKNSGWSVTMDQLVINVETSTFEQTSMKGIQFAWSSSTEPSLAFNCNTGAYSSATHSLNLGLKRISQVRVRRAQDSTY